MSDWNQSVCDRCWDLFNPGRPAVRVIDAMEEICAVCGEKTHSGIYIRADPAKVPYPRKAKR